MAEASDAAWAAWLKAVGDPQHGAQLAFAGQLRLDRWDMGVRTLPVHMLHYVQAGGHLGRVGGVDIATRRDAILWVPAGVEQDLRMSPQRPFAMIFVRLAIPAASPPGEPYVREHVPGAYPLFSRLLGEARAPLRASPAAVRALATLIFVEWRRAGLASGAGLSAAQRARVLAAVDRDHAHRLSPAWLARDLGLGPGAFTRRFTRTFGVAPRTWLMQRRIRLAAERLQELGEPVGAVAAHFGYPDLFLFSRQFKRVLGIAPSRWAGRARDGG